MLRVDRIVKFVLGIVIGIGILLCVLWLTGVLQSNQRAFIKEVSYLEEPIQKLFYSPNTNFQRLARLQYYTKEGKATFQLNGYHQLDWEEKLENNTEIRVNGKINGTTKQAYLEYGWMNEENELLKTKVIRDDQKIGFQSDEIVTAYVAIENSNLSNLLEVFGQEFPYEIQQVELNSLVDLFNMETIEKETLNNYVSLLKVYTQKENYEKVKKTFTIEGKQKEITGYQLKLSKEDTKNLILGLIQNLQQDSILLNMLSQKMKTIGFSEEASNVNQINTNLEDWIQKISEGQYETEELVVSFYSWKKTCLQCEIQYGQEKFVLQYNPETGSVEFLFDTEKHDGKIIKQQVEGNQTNLQVQVKKAEEEEWEAAIKTVEKNSGVQNAITINWKDSNGTATLSYIEENTFQKSIEEIEKLTSNNSATINEYVKEDAQALINAIKEQWKLVIQNKKNQVLETIQE